MKRLAVLSVWSAVAGAALGICVARSYGATPLRRDANAACPAGRRIPPADEAKTLSHDGKLREYRVHVPPSYDGKSPTPLVFSLHGLTSNATEQEKISGLSSKADAEGFVVVYPEGLGKSWNAGGCCGPASDANEDDVGFLVATLAAVSADLCIDARRVYASGMSNGGYMAYRLACDPGLRVSAVASVAGAMPPTACNPGREVPIIHFHGTKDPIVPFSLGETTVSGWVAANGCGVSPRTTYSKGDSTCQMYTCKHGTVVTFCSVKEGGHTWPGSLFPFPQSPIAFGKTTRDLSATDVMWDFFKAHPLP